MKNIKSTLLQLAMVKRILAFVFDPQWSTLRTSIPAFKTACDHLQALADAFDAEIAQYRKIISGIAVQKKDARIALAQSSFAIMSSVRSWALKNSDQILAANMKVSLSQLKNMPFAALVQKATQAISVVTPLVPQLADFNVTNASITQWNADLANMNSLISGPKSAIVARKTLGATITIDMKSMLNFLDNQLTPLVSNFLSIPEFFLGFYNNKRIGKPDVHHTRLIANVADELGKPYYSVTVTVDKFTDPVTGKIYAADSAISDSAGNCEVSAFFPGFRTVTISGSNIETKTFPAINFKGGKSETRQFVVKPSFSNIPQSAPAPAQKENA